MVRRKFPWPMSAVHPRRLLWSRHEGMFLQLIEIAQSSRRGDKGLHSSCLSELIRTKHQSPVRYGHALTKSVELELYTV